MQHNTRYVQYNTTSYHAVQCNMCNPHIQTTSIQIQIQRIPNTIQNTIQSIGIRLTRD